MFKLNEINKNHFIIYSDEPTRIEIIRDPRTKNIIAFGYKGTKNNIEQEADIVYDGNI
jgi:hypothetical protein